MKKYFFLAFLLPFILLGCKKSGIASGTPKCVEHKIEDFSKMSITDNGANVKKYKFQENTVYVFDPGNSGADITSEVIDSDCNTLGFLGGITGNTIIKGQDFSNATFIKIVWEK
ncbi:MAG: hypothetical protein V2A54_07635 [Bacteroidota bacterium]